MHLLMFYVLMNLFRYLFICTYIRHDIPSIPLHITACLLLKTPYLIVKQ